MIAVLALVLTALAGVVAAGPRVEWTATFGGPFDDRGGAVVRTAAGGFAIAGSTKDSSTLKTDVYVLQVDSAGQNVWSRAYGGADDDEACAIQPAGDGFVVAGSTRSFGAGQRDIWLIWIGASGEMLRTATFGGAGDEELCGMARASGRGYLLAAASRPSGPTAHVWLLRLNEDGKVMWTRSYRDGGVPNGVCAARDGGWFVYGTRSGEEEGEASGFVDKLDSLGNRQWIGYMVQGDFAETEAVLGLDDGGCVVAGSRGSYGSGSWMTADRFDAKGERVWYEGCGVDYPNEYRGKSERGTAVVRASSGDLVVAGWTRSDTMPSANVCVTGMDCGVRSCGRWFWTMAGTTWLPPLSRRRTAVSWSLALLRRKGATTHVLRSYGPDAEPARPAWRRGRSGSRTGLV